MHPKPNNIHRYPPHILTHHSQRYATPLQQIHLKQNIPTLSLDGSPTSHHKHPNKLISSMVANINIQDRSKRAHQELDYSRVSRSSAIQSKYSKYVKKLNMVNEEEQPATNNKSVSNNRLQNKNISICNFQDRVTEFPGAVSEYTEEYEQKELYGEQIRAIFEYIEHARQKKSEIESLLNEEEAQASSESKHYTDEQLGNSLRKLKRVVRLMEIVCKLILGTQSQITNNSHVHNESVSSLYHQMGLSTLQSQSFQTYELELKCKDREIARLQKLVEMLSAPEKGQNPNKSYEDQYVIRSDIVSKDISTLQNEIKSIEIAIQTENLSVQVQDASCQNQIEKNLKIQHAFSIWNIFDHEQSAKISQQNRLNKSIQTNKTLKFSIDTQTESESQQKKNNEISVVDEHLYMRRYKSLIKLCSYALNLVIGLCFHRENTETIDMKRVSELSKKIHEFADNFNEKYSQSKEENKYDDIFCQQTKSGLQKLYDQLKKIVRL